MIFFRDQDLTADQHKAFGRRFGSLQVHPFAPQLDGHPEILVIENDEARPSRINNWHTDVTFLEKPPLGSILHAREVPGTGGAPGSTDAPRRRRSRRGRFRAIVRRRNKPSEEP